MNFVLLSDEVPAFVSSILPDHSALRFAVFTSCAMGAGKTLNAFLVLILYCESGANVLGLDSPSNLLISESLVIQTYLTPTSSVGT